jgi:hypothetical protein
VTILEIAKSPQKHTAPPTNGRAAPQQPNNGMTGWERTAIDTEGIEVTAEQEQMPC